MNRNGFDCLILLPLIVGIVVLTCRSGHSENINPQNDDSRYAYGENVGWLNAEPSGEGGPGIEVEDLKLTGYLWSGNLGWINLNPTNYGGVANDGDGNLCGYAWSENAGWINFAPTWGGVQIDTVTGEFRGTAWGENIGWISFRGEGPISFKMITSWAPDSPGNCGFDSDEDGDVDGADLADFTNSSDSNQLANFSPEFGRVDCNE